MMAGPTIKEREEYIRQAAIARGLDPDKIVRVARTEGLADGVWQSNAKKNGIREPSYGDFQLLVGGDGTGYGKGLGNKFIQETGLDPTDPSNYKAMTDFSLNHAVNNGWGAWYGPKNAGLDPYYGITPNAEVRGLTVNSVPQNDWSTMAKANMQPADPVVAVKDPVQEPTLGDRLGSSLFGDKLAAKLKAASTPATKDSPGGPMTQGLGILSNILGGGNKEPQPSAPIQSTLPAYAAEDAARAQGAAQLMASIMAKKRPQGMTINSMPGMF